MWGWRRMRWLPAVGLALVPFVGCDGASSTPRSITTPPTPPEPPAATVSFVESRLEVPEGESREVVVRYRITELAEPVTLELSPLEDTAEVGDYELGHTRIEIPAGNAVDDTAAVSLAALMDRQFAEGDEVLVLRLVPQAGARIQSGGDLEVVISDAGAVPCAGILLRATPPAAAGDGDRIATTIVSEWGPGNADVHLDWSGSYGTRHEGPHAQHHPFWRDGIARPNHPDFHLADWRIEPAGGSTRHVMTVEWLAEAELIWRYRSPIGACDGEPVARCGRSGCDLSP